MTHMNVERPLRFLAEDRGITVSADTKCNVSVSKAPVISVTLDYTWGGVSRASGTKIESVTPQGLVPFLQFASCPCQPDQGAPFSGLGEKVHIVTLEISLVVKQGLGKPDIFCVKEVGSPIMMSQIPADQVQLILWPWV